MIDPSDIQRIAALARLGLRPEEIAEHATQLDRILGHVGALASVDTSDVLPMMHAAGVGNVFRADEPRPSLSAADALRNAAETEGDLIRVPKTL